MDNKPFLLALNHMPGVGPRTILTLLKRWPDLQELFTLTRANLVTAGIPEWLAERIHTFNMHWLDADWQWANQPNHHLITLVDSTYPSLLKQIYDPPAVLYARGNLASLQQTCVAIVGTRKPSMLGQESAWQFAYELAQHGITIVSGLALGIDAQVHRGCIAAKGRTIAVMGTGQSHIYPAHHTKLAEQIIEDGLLLSEFPLTSLPKAGHFPRRNRIISGLCLSTLVVEAAKNSGSLITARFALEQNRDVLAIPGTIQNPQAHGCHQLLQQGAKLATCSRDVLEDLGINVPIREEKRISKGLVSDKQNLVKCIEFECTTLDKIVVRSGLNIEAVLCQLAELELQGVVKAIPGGYTRCNYER